MHPHTERSPLIAQKAPFINRARLSIRSLLSDCSHSFPAVLLGTLLNALDAVSYGILIFPATDVFADKQSIGVSMYLLTGIVSQLVYAVGGSGFAGANGTMMVEVIPFFHAIAATIAHASVQMNPDIREREIISTTLVAYALSSILTGLSFFVLGALKLGKFVEFFPRHVLVGCIGGIGIFLIQTAISVCTEMGGNSYAIALDGLGALFLRSDILALWLVPLLLAILLRTITQHLNHQLVLPSYFLVIAGIFYAVKTSFGLNLEALRLSGWLFELGENKNSSWYTFYSYFDFKLVNVSVLVATLPTQLAMLLFNVLHPPLNIPALAFSLGEEMNLDRELVGHGFSNVFAGLLGTIPNYLTYVNTIMFYRVGGTTRVAGILLALTTTALLLIGTGPMAFIPVPVVGGLIFVLGIDLIKEALWDTRHKTNRTEYLCIVSIMVVTTVYDFVTGFFFGIIINCLFLAIQTSRTAVVSQVCSGEACMSPVHRPSAQRAFIKQVSRETTIMRLHGSLFFGNIIQFESAVRQILREAACGQSPHPMRFLIADLSQVTSIDMSAVECLAKVQKILSSKLVTLVLSGIQPSDCIAISLKNAGILNMDRVKVFASLEEATVWTEDVYLNAWYWTPVLSSAESLLPEPSPPLSPRRSQLTRKCSQSLSFSGEPFHTIVRALFLPTEDMDFLELRPITFYFERVSHPESYPLWNQGDEDPCLYFIESGTVKAVRTHPAIEVTMVSGSVAGELLALFGAPCSSTATVSQPAVLWKLTLRALRRMEVEEPRASKLFLQLLVKVLHTDSECLFRTLASRYYL